VCARARTHTHTYIYIYINSFHYLTLCKRDVSSDLAEAGLWNSSASYIGILQTCTICAYFSTQTLSIFKPDCVFGTLASNHNFAQGKQHLDGRIPHIQFYCQQSINKTALLSKLSCTPGLPVSRSHIASNSVSFNSVSWNISLLINKPT
jgi:hypothetical protein